MNALKTSCCPDYVSSKSAKFIPIEIPTHPYLADFFVHVMYLVVLSTVPVHVHTVVPKIHWQNSMPGRYCKTRNVRYIRVQDCTTGTMTLLPNSEGRHFGRNKMTNRSCHRSRLLHRNVVLYCTGRICIVYRYHHSDDDLKMILLLLLLLVRPRLTL